MTQDAAQARKGSGLSVAGWPLRRKMALALAIPLLLAATLGGLRVQGDLADSRQAASSATQVTIIQPAVDYLTSSEAAMVAAQSDSAASQGDLIDAIGDIITDAETLVQARDSADLNELQAAHVDALLDLSQAMRAAGAEDLGPATWIALVRQLESSVSQLITSVNSAQKTPEPRLEQISQAMSGRLSLALQQGFVATALAQSGSQELFSEIGVEAAAIDRLAGSVMGAEDQTATLRSQNTRHAGQIRDDSATNFGGRDAYTPYDEITGTLIGGVTDSLDEAASDAQRNALIGAALTLVALGAAIAIAFIIARSLLEPIGRVREGALAVARHRLPDAVARIRAGQQPEPITPIDVTTNEEIGQVARAVDDLHRQAIHLASGEAQLRQTVNAMFVTLSRRSTSLVNQQLAQIERLEHDEEDPKRLESLFRLDHLASRMRRTADSLLILADAPNRAAGQFSLTVGEALQAATSAVQDYQRVQILSHLGTRVGDEAAADVVHLLTELVDNALTYSPPGEPVRLAAKLGENGVAITITDSGLGVPPAELEQLNSDLAQGAEATPETARRMGLFVVSRLAERHGIEAQLTRNLGGGMTATVLLPPSVLPELPQTAAPEDGAAAASVETVTSRSAEMLAVEAPEAPEESKREARNRARTERSRAKAAEKAAGRAAADEARAAETKDVEGEVAEAEVVETKAPEPPAAEQPPAAVPEVGPEAGPAGGDVDAGTSDRPSLESLLPRRAPGANLPRTGADAFLPPETSGATGPLFGKRTPDPVADEAGVAEESTEPDSQESARPAMADRVARVVPITALASRQRAQAEQAEQARVAAGEPVADEHPADEHASDEQVADEQASDEQASDEPASDEQASDEPVAEDVADEPMAVEAPVRAHDPLSDPLPADAFDEQDDHQAHQDRAEPDRAEPDRAEPDQAEPDQAEPDQAEPDQAEPDQAEPDQAEQDQAEQDQAEQDQAEQDQAEPVEELEPESEPEPAAAHDDDRDRDHGNDVEVDAADPLGLGASRRPSAEEHQPVDEPVAEEPVDEPHDESAAAAYAAIMGAAADRSGLSSVQPAPSGGESPIFKSMRSGWLADEGQGEWHETEIDRGWEIAEHVEEVAVAQSTVTGLPRRAPGERLVPGSVTPPTAAKTRDPEAIRRRLQAHTAGVSRGRRVAQSSSQHTEAGPA